MSKQMFHKGDLVHVTKDMPSYMSHFTGDSDAIVIGSYADQYGGTTINDYTLHLKGRGQTSWYEENQLTLIERNRSDLLKTWDYQRVAGILDDILVTYGLRTNNKIVNKWASELPVFNSYGQMMPRLRRAYQNNDLETITELIGNDLKLLQEIEPNLRPLLEQAGYSNLLWWT
ncbi:hypothetical protein LCGC14_2155950 [marine sediment metagenome]|uniref:Uncharacterized protein n=1 Tax=marine sediment metagenome TaxID=412755 RepID=A0A0F9DUC8_9ZZZZ